MQTNEQIPVIPVVGRSCGTCSMCCKLGTVAEVDKPDGQWCQYCTTKKQCDIYESRPNVCRTYYCYYMLSDLGEEWKPSTAKLMVSAMANGSACITVDPDRPDAWKKEPYFSRIRQWSTQTQIIVFVGLHVIAVYPDRIDELGSLDGEHSIIWVDEQTSAGTIKRAQRKHKSELSNGTL
jgi:uncharacterized protein